MRDYEQRKAARIERLRARAAAARAQGNERIDAARQLAERIPLGQPILVGHHSERRARRDAERIRNGFTRGFERLKLADELDRRARAAEQNTAISSDDPDAVEKLRAELAKQEAFHARWKAINKALNLKDDTKRVAALKALQLTEAELSCIRNSPCGTGYMTTNASARIRRVKERIAELEARASAPVRPPETIGDITIEESENRVRIRFPDKPSAELRSELKRAGFRFAPSEGAWQRHASVRAWSEARRIAELARPGAYAPSAL